MDDVLLNKAAIIERSLKRISEEFNGFEDELGINYTKQDSIILNLLRACEASIDSAMHVVRIKKLGIPQNSRDAFDLMGKAGFLEAKMVNQMKAMVGFRNTAVHDYQKINLDILRIIIKTRLVDFQAYTKALLALSSD